MYGVAGVGYEDRITHPSCRQSQVSKTFFQRIFGTGTIGISSAGQAEVEILVRGMPDPDDVRVAIHK